MSDRVNLLRRVETLDIAPTFTGVSKLVCHIDNDTQMSVGDNTGYTLEFDNPMMTREVLTEALNKIRGYQYQPYAASGALLDPAAEMGDAISVRDVYGGLYTRSRSFSRLMSADISAPQDEEIDHEYKFETKSERKVRRELGDVRATLIVQSGMISSVVEDVGNVKTVIEQLPSGISNAVLNEGGNTSFKWVLKASGHKWYANGDMENPVLSITKSGLTVNGKGTFSGKITATSGKIGGFDISSSSISYNKLTWGGTRSGVYIGTEGIQLGNADGKHAYFQVSKSGEINARSMNAANITLTGTLTIGGKTITASNLQLGASQAASNYGTWTTGAGYGYAYNEMINNRQTATYLHGKYIYADNNINTPRLLIDGDRVDAVYYDGHKFLGWY